MSVLKKEIQSIRFKIDQMLKTESNYYLKTVTRCDSVWEPCTDTRNVFSEKKIENLSKNLTAARIELKFVIDQRMSIMSDSY
jgi:hypothetical protein